MIPVSDALFILQGVRQGILDFERGRRLVQSLSGHATGVAKASAYRLAIELGYATREQAAYIRAAISDLLGGPDWDPDDLLRELRRICPPGEEEQAAPAIGEDVLRRRKRQLKPRPGAAKDRSVLTAFLGGFLRNLAYTLVFVLILGGLFLLIVRSGSSQLKGKAGGSGQPSTVRKDTPEAGTTGPTEAPPDSGKTRSPGRKGTAHKQGDAGLDDRAFEAIPDSAKDLLPEYQEHARRARIHVDRGEFLEAFGVLDTYKRRFQDEFWRIATDKLAEQFRGTMRGQFAVVMVNFAYALAAGDWALAEDVLDYARRYAIPAGMSALAAQIRKAEQELDAAKAHAGPAAVPPLSAEELKAFFGASGGLSSGQVKLQYNFSHSEHAWDWWMLGLPGRIAGGAMETPQSDLAWPGSCWLVHKAEFDRISGLEFQVKVNQIDDAREPHLGWGLHLAAVPDGPWEVAEVEKGGIGWLRPGGLTAWTDGLPAWESDDSGVRLEKGKTYRFALEFKAGVVAWSVNGELLRRVPLLPSLGPRLVIMTGGVAAELSQVSLVASPSREWLREEVGRASAFRAEIERIRRELEEGKVVNLVQDRRLQGLCRNPRQYGLACPDLAGDDEVCVRDDLGPLIPARLPLDLLAAELSGQIKPMAKGGRDWYFGLLQNGISGYSLAFYFQKAYVGLNIVQSQAVHPAVENLEEAFNIVLGEDEYHPFKLRFQPGQILFELSEYPVVKSSEQWTKGGELSLGGYDWGGVGHYHLRNLQLKLVK
jgi:hypothetical protein